MSTVMSSLDALVRRRPGCAEYRAQLSGIGPTLAGSRATVAGLTLYPIEPLAGVALESAYADESGLRSACGQLADGVAMIAFLFRAGVGDQAYDFVPLRLHDAPALARIRVEHLNDCVVLCRGDRTLAVHASRLRGTEGEKVRVRLFPSDRIIPARVDPRPQLRSWVRGYLAASECTRIRVQQVEILLLEPDPAFTAASAATLRWVNGPAVRGDGRELEEAVFRPRILLDGIPPNAEDLVAEMETGGGIRLRFEGPRAHPGPQICIDPLTGDVGTEESWRRLLRVRPPSSEKANDATFGVRCGVRAGEGLIGRGEECRIVSVRE